MTTEATIPSKFTDTQLGRMLFAGVGVYVVSTLVSLVQRQSYEIATLTAFGAYVLIGRLIVVRRGNALGLTLVAYGSAWALITALISTAESLDEAGRIDAAAWVSLLGMVVTAPTLWLLSATWLIFPDGRTTTKGDRRILRGSAVATGILTMLSIFATPQVLPESKAYPHPFIDDELAQTIFDGTAVFGVLFFFLAPVVAVRLIVRMRHGNPIERRQVSWIAVAVIANIAILMFNVAVAPLGTEDNAFLLIDAVAVVLIPLAIGVAIMRYRLYEIDRIISRSVTFGALAAFIGGVYIAIVVGVGELLGGDASFGLSIVASVLVAMAFQPMRRRVERWANRLVYGERATPYEVLVRFSRRSAELSDEELLERIPRLIVDGTGAASATLWTRVDDGFRVAATWPEEPVDRGISDVEAFVDGEADFSVPVAHDGEILGGLSLVKAGGEEVTPADEVLLRDLASGLGLSLRNARLTGSLRRQVAELEASRERVLTAADAARRALEHDLDSGPQQQLVALKVKLGPMRVLSERAGAEKTAKLLGQLEAEAGAAIQAIRDFAGGIYPPLLEAEGLMVAIGQQARTAPIPVEVHGNGVGRYSREVEAAVYFSVLEALQNIAKYAEASSASVTLTHLDGDHDLTFEVCDDGRGFDVSTMSPGAGLSGMTDRLDTVGGQMTIESVPWSGTTVAGTLPITQPDTAILEPA